MIIPVRAATHHYEVVIGKEILKSAVQSHQALFDKADHIVVLTDENVWAANGEYFTDAISYPFEVLVMPSGEACKTFSNFEHAHTFLLEKKCTRKSLLLAFGGGAVGDLAGFVAATYMRGIPFIQVPTTILAHDSAVGGKTAINHPLAKNIVGAFYQPEAVLFDTNFLTSLPKKEVRSGMAEVIKHAMISDATWLQELMQLDVTAIDEAQLAEYLAKGIQVKAGIVEQDETEQSVRKYLNLGHTYGHAIEAAAGYGKLTHGEAVMIGLIYMLLLSESHGDMTRDFTLEFAKFAVKNGYPLEAVYDYSFEELKEYMYKDKKADYGELQFVLLQRVGVPFMQKMDAGTCQQIDEKYRELIAEVLT